MLHDNERHRHLPPELDVGYAMTFRRLRRLFQSRGVPREEAADLAQEAIARALLHLRRNGTDSRYDGVDPLLNRIATNLLIDRARAAGPRLVSIDDAEDMDDGRHDPSEEVARLHEHRAVRSAIGDLSPRHRHALLLSLEGKSPAEIAEQLGIQRNAADALLHRARRRLADRLRVGTDAALGLVAIVGLRVRWAARRATDAVRSLGPQATSPAAINVAALALATALGTSAVTNAPADRVADAAPARTLAAAPATAERDVSVARDVRSDVASVAPSAADREAGAVIENPVTNNENGGGVRHRTKGTDGGATAVVLDLVCGTTAMCAEEPSP